VAGGAVHFDGADVDTLIIGVGMGAWTTVSVEEPCPDRRADPATGRHMPSPAAP
jgi:hypothetical protein